MRSRTPRPREVLSRSTARPHYQDRISLAPCIAPHLYCSFGSGANFAANLQAFLLKVSANDRRLSSQCVRPGNSNRRTVGSPHENVSLYVRVVFAAVCLDREHVRGRHGAVASGRELHAKGYNLLDLVARHR